MYLSVPQQGWLFSLQWSSVYINNDGWYNVPVNNKNSFKKIAWERVGRNSECIAKSLNCSIRNSILFQASAIME